jgi:60 kDa SS-A/Ro ribonucleoprotein
MANLDLFASFRGLFTPKAEGVNQAGGRAYILSDEQALAQLAMTGCLNATFYATAQTQLAELVRLAARVSPTFLAKPTVHARAEGFMKDTPAVLLAVLSLRDPALFAKVFDRVIDNAKMLRTFVQVMRSGQMGRKSLGTRPKKKILGWLSAQSDDAVFRACVGDKPSLADVVRMVHPTPATPSRRALYGYLLDKPHEVEALPPLVRAFEAYKASPAGAPPDVPFQLLTSLGLDTAAWAEIAKRASWQTTRMNLNTFHRHGVFEVPGMTELLAARLADRDTIRAARVFPYQLLVAYLATRETGLPVKIVEALHDALEIATENVPVLPEQSIQVLVDVSGSMRAPVTGERAGATTAARCVDVAALVAATILRKNRTAEVLCFDTAPRTVALERRDSIMTNAKALAAVGGGGTNVSSALEALVKKGAAPDLVVLLSDNESWIDAKAGVSAPTPTMTQWNALRAKNPRAKLVCVDLAPNEHTQAIERGDILNVGGFSDQVFGVIDAFARGALGKEHWLGVIDAVTL